VPLYCREPGPRLASPGAPPAWPCSAAEGPMDPESPISVASSRAEGISPCAEAAFVGGVEGFQLTYVSGCRMAVSQSYSKEAVLAFVVVFLLALKRGSALLRPTPLKNGPRIY